jgi:hypothetical protein
MFSTVSHLGKSMVSVTAFFFMSYSRMNGPSTTKRSRILVYRLPKMMASLSSGDGAKPSIRKVTLP